ncbi:MAG: peptidoglycan DD-metalloendopeptidase family protein, partial [Candidatus Sericytochromatia bacterium]|nr:peptidoglycan DD-metalloendopeptidase family protein [Candidatus Tanganyikabacteria bacterium]
TIRRGDFPERVAKRFGLHPDTVLAANNLQGRSILQVGDQLKIPPADGFYHRVRRGESLPRLLKKHDLTEPKFRKFNPGVGDILRAKQVVFIPGRPPEVAEPKAEKRRAKRDRAANAEEPRQGREGRGYRDRDERKRGSRSFFGDVGRAIADGFHWPTPSRDISSGFGDRRRDFHAGLDIRAKKGTPIRAARDGVVVHSGWDGGYGRMVEIDHGGGVRTRYAHASSLHVDVGDRVSAGELIARVGSSGHSTGPHLHYEVRVNGRPVNPKKVH